MEYKISLVISPWHYPVSLLLRPPLLPPDLPLLLPLLPASLLRGMIVVHGVPNALVSNESVVHGLVGERGLDALGGPVLEDEVSLVRAAVGGDDGIDEDLERDGTQDVFRGILALEDRIVRVRLFRLFRLGF